MIQPSAEEETRRRFVEFTAQTIKNTSSTDYPGVYPGEDHSWSISKFKKGFRVEFHDSQPLDSTFSLIGLDASIANAYRRIMIAEVPSLAIENVYVQNNTSVIQDEVLAQRLGLIPFKVQREAFDNLHYFVQDSQPMSWNTFLVSLDVECDWTEDSEELYLKGEKDSNKLYKNSNVYARDFVFQPVMDQAKQKLQVTPVHPDILIAKMRPGQQIKLKAYIVKGHGADHIKFSPVATASYRLMPAIHILKPIVGADAKKFARCFPKGVIGLHKVTSKMAKQRDSGYEGKEGQEYAVVADVMSDPVTRECLRHPEFKDKVRLGRIQDHFIFRVESTGLYPSNDIFVEAAKILKYKCIRCKKALNKLVS